MLHILVSQSRKGGGLVATSAFDVRKKLLELFMLSPLRTWITENGGDRIRTCDLEVMSLIGRFSQLRSLTTLANSTTSFAVLQVLSFISVDYQVLQNIQSQ